MIGHNPHAAQRQSPRRSPASTQHSTKYCTAQVHNPIPIFNGNITTKLESTEHMAERCSLELASRLNLQRLLIHFLIREPFRRVYESFGPGRLIQGVALNAAGEAAGNCSVRLQRAARHARKRNPYVFNDTLPRGVGADIRTKRATHLAPLPKVELLIDAVLVAHADEGEIGQVDANVWNERRAPLL
eukprot:6943630-Prymnesium_polylepis.1